MSKNGCFRASKSGHIGKRQKLGRRRKVIKEQERWGTGTRNRPIIIHDNSSPIIQYICNEYVCAESNTESQNAIL